MGNKLTPRSHQQMEAIAKSLRTLAEQIATVADGMASKKDEDVPLPWNQRQFTALDVLIGSGGFARLMPELHD